MDSSPNNRRILVIKLSALGDFVLAFAPLAAIRKHHPDAKITLLTTKVFAGLAHQCPWVDDVIVDSRPGILNITAALQLRKTLQKENFDRVYDLQTNDRTKLYRKFFLPRAEWVGVMPGADYRLMRKDWKAMHALDRHREMLALTGIADMPDPDSGWMDADISHFKLPENFVLLVPGSAPQHPGKRWPAHRYAAFAQTLISQGLQPVLIGTRDEADVTQNIKQHCDAVIDLTGQTNLFEVAALARKARAAVGNDTGPIHLIAAANCPVLVLFSSVSDPERSAPRGDAVAILQCDALSELSVTDVYKTFKELCGF